MFDHMFYDFTFPKQADKRPQKLLSCLVECGWTGQIKFGKLLENPEWIEVLLPNSSFQITCASVEEDIDATVMVDSISFSNKADIEGLAVHVELKKKEIND